MYKKTEEKPAIREEKKRNSRGILEADDGKEPHRG